MKTSKVKWTHRLAAMAMTAGMMGQSVMAFAGGNDANTLAQKIVTSSGGFTRGLNLLAYIGGGVLTVAGITKLKAHVDNPQQTAMKDGLGRLFAGGALLTLPFITSVVQGSVGDSTSNPAINKVQNFN